MRTCEPIRDSLAAYSLDALDDAERRQVEAHLSRCQECTAEVAALAEIAAALGSAVPQVAPRPALRQRLLAEVAPRQRRDTRFPLPAFAWRPALTAAAALVAVGSFAWAVALQGQLGAQQATLARLEQRSERYERVVSVLGSPSTVVAELSGDTVAPSAAGRVIVDPSTQSGMLMVWDLPPLPRDRGYQVWFVGDGGRVSGGVVRPNERGGGYFFLQVPPDLSRYRGIGLTEEPAQGSPGPTGPRVLGGTLS